MNPKGRLSQSDPKRTFRLLQSSPTLGSTSFRFYISEAAVCSLATRSRPRAVVAPVLRIAAYALPTGGAAIALRIGRWLGATTAGLPKCGWLTRPAMTFGSRGKPPKQGADGRQGAQSQATESPLWQTMKTTIR
jgi:hypothetical protein